MASDLITLTEYLGFTDQLLTDLSTEDQLRITKTITSASEAIRSFTDRKLGLTADEPQTPRQYRYLGHGYIEIDDCTVINSISTVATSFATSRTLDATEWFAIPEGDVPVIDEVEFYTRFLATGLAPEMGFKRNLDNYPFVPYPTLVQVDATWGWPTIPDIVKQACAWTVETFINFKGQSPLDSESIASFSRSFNQFQPRSRYMMVVQAIPEQAIAALQPYIRVLV